MKLLIALIALALFQLPHASSVRVRQIPSSDLLAAITNDARPVYLDMPRMGRIQGLVDASLIVNPSGKVASYRILRGHPMLVQGVEASFADLRFKPDPSGNFREGTLRALFAQNPIPRTNWEASEMQPFRRLPAEDALGLITQRSQPRQPLQAVVDIFVSASGEVTEAELLVGDKKMRKEAVRVAMGFRFKPHLENGQAVPFTSLLEFQ